MSCNPHRKCGRKKTDSFYLEADIAGEDEEGTLRPFTWVLGDGLDKTIPMTIPPRKTIFLNPAATLSELELVRIEDGFDINERYYRMLEKTRDLGIGDHVGANNYSVWSFANEVIEYGPGRRITPQEAQMYAEILQVHGPFPMLFTHSRMPIFENEEQLEEAFHIVDDTIGIPLWGPLEVTATWDHQDWGQYARQSSGFFHPMRLILVVLDAIDKQWKMNKDQPAYIAAKKFFEDVSFVEQPFGLSWLTKVTYTLPEDVRETPDIIFDIPGINILDLEEHD